jgi:hypothetical protein
MPEASELRDSTAIQESQRENPLPTTEPHTVDPHVHHEEDAARITQLREQHAALLHEAVDQSPPIQPDSEEELPPLKTIIAQASVRGAEIREEWKRKYWHLRMISKVFSPFSSMGIFKKLRSSYNVMAALESDPKLNKQVAKHIDNFLAIPEKWINKRFPRSGVKKSEK